MKNKWIRPYALLSVCFLLIGVLFTACGKKNGDSANTGETDTAAATQSSGETTEQKKYDGVDGGGRDVLILNRVADSYLFAYNEVEASEDDISGSDLVNSTLYTRNFHVNELLNVNLVSAQMTAGKMTTTIRNENMNGLKTYDFMMHMAQDTFMLGVEGMLYEWNLIPYIDMSQDYWMTDFYNTTSIGGFNFYCPGSANISAYNTVGVTFFNKQLREAYRLENPYDLAKEGTWTIEKMQEMCRVVTSDTDGYPGMSYRDTYGLAVNSFVWQPFFYSSGYMMVEKDENDIPYLSATSSEMSEIVFNLLTAINDMVNNPELALLSNREEYSNAQFTAPNLETEIFLNNRSLFWVENIYGQYSLRDMQNDYGILPMPKWNERAPYASYTHAGHSSVMSVPRSAPDLKLSGAVIEEMTAYSEEVLIPEFYEQTIRIRGSRDAESYEMLDIIYENVFIDLAVVMRNSGLGLDAAIRNMLNFNDSGFSTMFKSQGRSYSGMIDSLAVKFATNAAKQYETNE